MTGVMSDQGEGITLRALLDKGLTLKLFKNDVVPGKTSIETDFTEADFPGYNNVSLNNANDWTIVEDAPSEASLSQQNFYSSNNISPPQIVYGYYFVITSSNKYVWGERSVGVIAANNDYYFVTPKFQLLTPDEV